MKRTPPVLFRRVLAAIGATAFAFTAGAQTVVDDFSANHIGANYTLMTAFDTTTVTVSSGTLQLENDSYYGSYIWNGPGNTGLALMNVGDTVSIQLQVTAGDEGGLRLWKTNTPAANVSQLSSGQLVDARYTTAMDGGNIHGIFLNNDNGSIYQGLDGAPTGFSTLTIAITDKTATDTTISFLFSGTGFAPISGSDTYAFTGPIYFGPSLYSSTVQYDNLTFTVIPEPAMCAAAAGLVAMVRVLRRRGRA